MSLCIFPGSFDPITRGHLNLIERAAAIFDEVIVTVMVNRSKEGTIPYEERARIIRKACADYPNVRAELWKGLLADYAREHPGSTVVRGIRSASEFSQELQAADMNRKLCPSLETVFLPAAPEWSGLSSSAVREIASFGGDVRPFVPERVCEDILKWLGHKGQKD